MATRNLCFLTNRLRNEAAYHGHAMSICMHVLTGQGGITVRICASPVFVGTDGCSVPISRGSPPTS